MNSITIATNSKKILVLNIIQAPSRGPCHPVLCATALLRLHRGDTLHYIILVLLIDSEFLHCIIGLHHLERYLPAQAVSNPLLDDRRGEVEFCLQLVRRDSEIPVYTRRLKYVR